MSTESKCKKCGKKFKYIRIGRSRKYCDIHRKSNYNKQPESDSDSEEVVPKKLKSKLNVSESIKKQIAGRQFFKCANKPNSNLKGLEGYSCHLWLIEGENKGCFDESNWEIDHIEEKSIGGTNDTNNLQALCSSCHSLKTKRFKSNGKNQNSQSNTNKFQTFEKQSDISNKIHEQELIRKKLETEKLQLENKKLHLEIEQLKSNSPKKIINTFSEERKISTFSDNKSEASEKKSEIKIYRTVLLYLKISKHPNNGGQKNSLGEQIYLPIYRGINITDDELKQLTQKYEEFIKTTVPLDKFQKHNVTHIDLSKFTNGFNILKGDIEIVLTKFLNLVVEKDINLNKKMDKGRLFQVDMGNNADKVKLFININMLKYFVKTDS